MSLTDAEVAHERDRIERLHATWAKALGVPHAWTIHTQYYREPLDARPHPDRQRPPECEHVRYGRAMQVTAQWEYQTADLEINCLLTARLTDEELTEYFLHELGHLYLAGLATVHGGRQEPVDHAWYLLEEHTATTLAFAFKWLAEGAWTDGLAGVLRHAEHRPPPEAGETERAADGAPGARDLRARGDEPESPTPGQEPHAWSVRQAPTLVPVAVPPPRP